jgi:hypothetical protein
MDDQAFSGRLVPGERIVWAGRPRGGIMFTRQDIFLVPFSLVWCGFAIFWETGVSGAGAPSFFKLWGALFVCIGLYLVAGRFLVDAWIRQGIRYALTDRRVLILRPKPFSDFIAVNLDRLPDARLSEDAHGRGTLRFGQPASMWNRRGLSSWTPALDSTPQFLLIDDARRVFDLVQRSAGHQS